MVNSAYLTRFFVDAIISQGANRTRIYLINITIILFSYGILVF